MSDPEKVGFRLGVTGHTTVDRLPELVEELSKLSQLSGISLEITHVTRSYIEPLREVPGLNQSLVEYEVKDGERVPVITRATMRRYAKDAGLNNSIVTQAWGALGSELAPITRTEVIAHETEARQRALSQEEADRFGLFEPWDNDGMGRLIYLHAEQFPEFMQVLDTKINVPGQHTSGVRSFGRTCIMLFEGYNQDLFDNTGNQQPAEGNTQI